MKSQILRGELYYADLEPIIGSEQGGERPVVIQNNKGNRHSKTVIIAPLTTSLLKPTLPTHVGVHTEGLRSTSIVLLEQIRTIDMYPKYGFGSPCFQTSVCRIPPQRLSA